MDFEQCEYMISEHWLPAIFNGDFSGLDEDDETRLENFLNFVQEQHGSGHWSCDDELEEFARCEISNLHAYCTKLIYNAIR